MIDPFLSTRLKLLIPLFEKNNVEKAYVFGSVCTNRFSENSDVDFLVKFKPGLNPLEKGENWWELFYSPKLLLNRDVDLLTEDSLLNPYFVKVMDRTKTPIYGG